MMTKRERRCVEPAPRGEGAHRFLCRLCERTFAKRTAYLHFTTTAHQYSKEVVRHWVVVRDAHRLSNGYSDLMELERFFAAAEEGGGDEGEKKPQEEEAEEEGEGKGEGEGPGEEGKAKMPDADTDADTVPVDFPATIVDATDAEEACCSVMSPADAAAIAAFARRRPIPRSWSGTPPSASEKVKSQTITEDHSEAKRRRLSKKTSTCPAATRFVRYRVVVSVMVFTVHPLMHAFVADDLCLCSYYQAPSSSSRPTCVPPTGPAKKATFPCVSCCVSFLPLPSSCRSVDHLMHHVHGAFLSLYVCVWL